MKSTIFVCLFSLSALAGPYPGGGPYPLPWPLLSGGSTFGPSTSVGQQIYYVATNGNDATAVLNRPDLPWLNISNAVALATNGQIVQLGYGKFYYTNLVPNPYVTINGMGLSNTSILSWQSPTNASIIQSGDFPAALYITNSGVTLSNLRIGFADPNVVRSNSVMPVVLVNPDPLVSLNLFAEKLMFVNVQMDGVSDGLYVETGAHNSGTFIHCNINTLWDDVIGFNANIVADSFDFYDCNLTASNNTVVSTQCRNVVSGDQKGVFRFFGGTLTVNNTISAGTCNASAVGGHIELYGTFMSCSSNSIAGTNTICSGSGTIKYVGNTDYDSLYGAQTRYGNPPTQEGLTTNTPIAGAFISPDATSAQSETRFWSINGGALTNLVANWTTNAIPALVLSVGGKAYTTNLAANIVLANFASVPNNLAWDIWVFATNNSGANHSITGPNGSSGSYLGVSLGKPVVYWITNQQSAWLDFKGYGQATTNLMVFPQF